MTFAELYVFVMVSQNPLKRYYHEKIFKNKTWDRPKPQRHRTISFGHKPCRAGNELGNRKHLGRRGVRCLG